MDKNLIISAVGDKSLHEKWIGSNNIDLFLIYYGDDEENAKRYKDQSTYFIQMKTLSKYDFLKNIIIDNYIIMQQYNYIWLPDDDLDINFLEIEKMFEIMKRYDLWIAQPSVINNVNLPITASVKDSDMRFTNFVETMAPAFKRETMMYLCPTFGMTQFMWGVENIWTALLGTPKNKIAIIDSITMDHTKLGGSDYSRFKTDPYKERTDLWKAHKNLLVKTNAVVRYNKRVSFKDLDNKEEI